MNASMKLVYLSHIVNVLVAGMMGTLLFFNSNSQIIEVFGPQTPARQILSCVYLSIAIMSSVALISKRKTISIAVVLFPMQIVYKILTLIAVSDILNPIPWSNLAISILHAYSLYLIYKNDLQDKTGNLNV
jgi:hypothetical protein